MSHTTRCFSTGLNKYKSSQDYTNRKTASTLYTTTATNTKTNKKTDIQAIISQPDNCLASVGGFNVNSYDLHRNLTKGKYYTSNNLLANIANVDCSQNISNCRKVDISNNVEFASPDYTYDMYEGPFLTSKSIESINNSVCLPPTLKDSLEIDASGINVCNYSFAKMVSREKLRNFDYPIKFNITYP